MDPRRASKQKQRTDEVDSDAPHPTASHASLSLAAMETGGFFFPGTPPRLQAPADPGERVAFPSAVDLGYGWYEFGNREDDNGFLGAETGASTSKFKAESSLGHGSHHPVHGGPNHPANHDAELLPMGGNGSIPYHGALIPYPAVPNRAPPIPYYDANHLGLLASSGGAAPSTGISSAAGIMALARSPQHGYHTNDGLLASSSAYAGAADHSTDFNTFYGYGYAAPPPSGPPRPRPSSADFSTFSGYRYAAPPPSGPSHRRPSSADLNTFSQYRYAAPPPSGPPHLRPSSTEFNTFTQYRYAAPPPSGPSHPRPSSTEFNSFSQYGHTAPPRPSSRVLAGLHSTAEDPNNLGSDEVAIAALESRRKTVLCKYYWSPGMSCRLGDKCDFAHAPQELRVFVPGPDDWFYKTKLCKYWKRRDPSSCPYGARCVFAHGLHDLRHPDASRKGK